MTAAQAHTRRTWGAQVQTIRSGRESGGVRRTNSQTPQRGQRRQTQTDGAERRGSAGTAKTSGKTKTVAYSETRSVEAFSALTWQPKSHATWCPVRAKGLMRQQPIRMTPARSGSKKYM